MSRPNVILFCAEDLDYEGLGCYDASATGVTGLINAGVPATRGWLRQDRMLTPCIDALAADGLRSDNYWCVSAICTPARYSLLTGRYPERNPHFCSFYPPDTQAGIFFNIGIDPGEPHLGHAFQACGYRTCITGKWHNFPQQVKLRLKDLNLAIDPEADPRDPAVDRALKEAYRQAVAWLRRNQGWDVVDRLYFDNPEPWHPRRIAHHNLEWIIEGALQFLESQRGRDEPFFLYVPVTIPHRRYDPHQMPASDPLATPQGMLAQAPQTGMPSRAAIAAEVEAADLPGHCTPGRWLDTALEVLLDKARKIGAAENLCTIFTSDHPTAGKETTHLGRLPLIVHYPGQVPAGQVCEAMLSQTDLAPSLLGLCGCPVPRGMADDGLDQASVLRGEASAQRDMVFMEVVHSRAIVHQGFKYIANRIPPHLQGLVGPEHAGWLLNQWYDQVQIRQAPAHRATDYWPSYFEQDQLYDLQADPMEQKNLIGDPQYAGRLKELRQRLQTLLASLPHVFGEFVPTPTGASA